MTQFDVTGIGNAIIDVIAPCEPAFLQQYNIERGSMTLIDQSRAQELYATMQNPTAVSGGSAANTMAGFASFGGRGNYIGLVARDELGDVFARDIKNIGTHFETPRFDGTLETARSFIFVTPDGERSMNTFLGACTELGEEHINESQIANSAITYMEGYLFDKDAAKSAFRKSADIARKNGRRVSLSLSDSFCVNRHRADFLDLIKQDIDILFANEDELKALYQTDDLNVAIDHIKTHCDIAAITRSENGSIIIGNGEYLTINAESVDHVIDSTGAGDQYAAGFLYGLVTNQSLSVCGTYASRAAAEVISHIGPRPQTSYDKLVKAA